jgi:hypothetical protein
MGATNKIIKIILGIMLLVCLVDMPYGYYQLVRFLGMIGFGILAYSAYQRKDNSFFIIWASSVVLISPLIKIALGRELWNVVDVIWAILLFASLKLETKK